MRMTRIIVAAVAVMVVAWMPSTPAISGSPTPINPSLPITEITYYAIRLVCPKHPSDTMYYWIRNKREWTTKFITKFSGGSPKTIKMLVVIRDNAPKTALDTSVDAPTTETERHNTDGADAAARR